MKLRCAGARRWAWLAWLLLAAAGTRPALAQDAAAAARGSVVLTVSGKLAGGQDQVVQFDLTQLSALPQHSIHTQTPWYPGPRTFSGPLLRDVLSRAGAKGQVLHARAINDYKVNIPASDAERFKPVLALQIDGKPITLRDKGPIFIVYPYDHDPQLRSSVYYSRSIWQLKALEVR